MFVNNQVTMLRPKENQDEWFNLFAIHQNRCVFPWEWFWEICKLQNMLKTQSRGVVSLFALSRETAKYKNVIKSKRRFNVCFQE